MADILATLSKLRHRDDDDHPEVKLLFFAEFAYCFMNLRQRLDTIKMWHSAKIMSEIFL
jgi:hypothetical protein